MPLKDWNLINQKAIAKALREMIYEETISVEKISTDGQLQDSYILKTSSATYSFNAIPGAWGDLRVEIGSIRRDGITAPSAPQFIIDTQEFTKMTDIVLANFIEEMNNSLWADLKIHQKTDQTSLASLLDSELENIQHFLFGHPKIINSKGRLGWGLDDQYNYAPENEVPIQFAWLAVDKELSTFSIDSTMDWKEIYNQSFAESALKNLVQEFQVNLDKYILVPVHPWQWDKYIYFQFQDDLHSKKIIYLGIHGDFYQPQISLRTFNNVSRPGLCDIKLPISILNTSSIRGIPARYIQEGPALSNDFERLCQTDEALKEVKILKEIAGVSVAQACFQQIKEAPYRYHELLGAIWRLSPLSVRKEDHSSMMVGSLLAQNNKETLVEFLIQKSGLSATEWIRAYTQKVIIPLFHLQLHHGVGLVSHGQNIVLELKHYVPVGLILKDFQGDLRLSEKSQALNQKLTRLPAHYLIHDLITGHFVTFLRYLSGVMADSHILSEKDFYQTMNHEISSYVQSLGPVKDTELFRSINILSPELPKVLINAVRYKVGYSDSAERPLPMLGTNIKNPLANLR